MCARTVLHGVKAGGRSRQTKNIKFPVRRVRFMAVTAAEKEKLLDELLAKYQGFKGATIPVLQKAQEIFGYLPKDVLIKISKAIDVPISKIYGVVTFYAQFHLEPRGEHIVRSCQGTACHVRGGKVVLEAMQKKLGLSDDKCTTDDLKFTIETVACIGACALAPCVMVDEDTHGRLTTDKACAMLDTYANA